MDRILREQFFSSILRMKKMGAIFPNECEIQMSELRIMERIIDGCDCSGCPEMNLNIAEIQGELHVSKPAISQTLNTLEKKGYILRKIDPKDRRKIALTATAEGKAAVVESAKQYDAMTDKLLTRFGEDNMRLLIELLTRLAVTFEECKEELPPEK